MLRKPKRRPTPSQLGELRSRSGSASSGRTTTARSSGPRWENRDQRRLRLADPQPGRLRRLRARHDRAARLDDRRRPPLQHPPAPAAPEHDAGARPGARSPTSRALARLRERRAARARPPAVPDAAPRAASPASRAIAWDEALDLVAERIRDVGPGPARLLPDQPRDCRTRPTTRRRRRCARWARTRSTTPPASATRRAPSALKEALGVAATTCSYSDWIGTDLIVFIGSNVANNQPVTTKYLHLREEGRDEGRRRQPLPRAGDGALLDPLDPRERAVRDEDRRPLLPINVGGDVGFLCRRAEALIERGLVDERVRRRAHRPASTSSRETLAGDRLGASSRRLAGTTRERDARRSREMLGEAERGGLRLEHGRHPARARRGQRAGDRQPRARPRLRRPRGLRADADPRPLRRPGRRRDGLLRDRLPRRRAGRRRERRARSPSSGASRFPPSPG